MNCTRWIARASLTGLLAGEKVKLMSIDLSFTAAMVQMRTGLVPEPNLETGAPN